MSAAVPAAVPARLSRAQISPVALMMALSAMSYFDRTIMSIAGPTIMKEFSISETEMGSVYFMALLSYTICMTPGGWLTDRLGPRLTLTLSVLGTALFTGLTALAGKPGLGAIFGVVPSFLIVRFIFGVTAAPIYPATGRMSANWIPMSAQAWVQALIMASSSVGAATSPLLFAWLIAERGWRASFWIVATGAFVLGLVWFWSVRDLPPGQAAMASRKPRVSNQWKRLLTDKNLLVLTGGYFLLNYFEYIFFYWIYYYFGQIRHLGASETSRATAILFLGTVVMTPLGGKISDLLSLRYGLKSGRRLVAMTGMVASAALLALGASGFGVTATVVLLMLAFGSAMSTEGPFWATAIGISGEQAGAACGIFNTGGNLGGMLAPLITPIIAARFGWESGLYFGSFMVLLGVASWLLIDPAKQIAFQD